MSKQLKDVASWSSHIYTVLTLIGLALYVGWLVAGHIRDQAQDIEALVELKPKVTATEELAQQLGRGVRVREAMNEAACNRPGNTMPEDYCRMLKEIRAMED